MSRSRRPVKAIDEAVGIAGRRGCVEQVTGKRSRAFDFIIFETYRNVLVKVKRSQTSFTYALEILHSDRAGDREPSPRGLNLRYRPKIPGPVSRRGHGSSSLIRHDSVIEIRADGMYIPCESLPVKTVDLSVNPDDGTNDPVFPSEERE